ncbi:MAG: hypothetical protein DIU78_005355 [Pseudomonadota bacterium]|nr:MAG: hypothetical protein DIU78_04930 [Pseudomonadota bacterium]
MAACNEKAVLIVTRQVPDTATNVARRRIELSCQLTLGHSGPHRDMQHGEEWESTSSPVATLFRHEDEEG